MGTYCSTCIQKLGPRPTIHNELEYLIRLHGEVCVLVVVEQDVADHLVEHGEERAEGPEPGEVHDVLLGGGVLEALGNQVVRSKERLDDRRYLVLHLKAVEVMTWAQKLRRRIPAG